MLFILHFTSSIVAQCTNCNSLQIQKPVSNWATYPATITEATLIVKPKGLFVEYGFYLTYSAASNYSYGVKDTFEIQHFFQLPENAIINDSWLWVDNTIMKALILDRWSAFNIYEGIVKRRKDPSILFKNNQTSYEYRIYPLAGGGKTRKVKLSILVPAKWSDGRITAELPISMIKNSYKIPTLNVQVFESKEWKIPQLSVGTAFTEVQDSILGNYQKATISNTQLSQNNSITLSMQSEKKSGVYFTHYQDSKIPDEGIYQLAIQPKNLLPANAPKKILYLIDHQTNNANLTEANIKSALKNQLLTSLNSKDSFNIFYNRLSTKKVSNYWIPADSASINAAIQGIVLGTSGNLKNGITESYDFILKNKGNSLMILSSSIDFNSVIGSQSFKDELVNEFKTLPSTFVLDYATKGNIPYIWYNGKYYYGNELFYNILTSNTLGTYIQLSNNQGSISLEKGLEQINSAFDASLFNNKSIELFIKPETGACFERYEINSNAENISKPIIQVGKYKGTLPLKLETIVVSDGVVSTNQLVLPPNDWNLNNTTFTQIHAGLKVINLETKTGLSNAQITNIIDISKKNRVLSLYTSFLALEPGLQEPCLTCVDETGGGTVDTKDATKDSVSIKIFPNPFRDQVTIEIAGLTADDDINEMSIHNMQGQLVQQFDNETIKEEKLILTWVAENQASGMYIFKLKVGSNTWNRKLIKL
jgi:Ca-activated chloride channel family protein